jgi:pyridine nucleotide-disulfide oxidoreductase family protein
MSKRLVLLGGGHAHLHVLQDFARQPLAGTELLLITPFARQVYSGMVPGVVAGHYAPDASAIALQPLATAARARWVEASAVGLDAAARCVQLSDGRVAEYDLLSIDTGGVMDRDRLPGAREQGLFVRPMESFLRLLPAFIELAQRRVLDVVVLGGGAAGVELALALQHRLGLELPGATRGAERVRMTLLTGGGEVLTAYPAGVQRRAIRVLAARGIALVKDSCVALQAGTAQLQGGARLACDAALIATGAEAPSWLGDSGLALDAQGFVQTGATQQSSSHAEVFAVGDVASRIDAPHARSGVYAVRAGPPLALNLRHWLGGGELQAHRPQKRTLNLLACGDKQAIASWGSWSAQGAWAWWWKDRIDRGFVRRFSMR